MTTLNASQQHIIKRSLQAAAKAADRDAETFEDPQLKLSKAAEADRLYALLRLLFDADEIVLN